MGRHIELNYDNLINKICVGLPMSVKDNICVKGCDATVGVAKNCFVERGEDTIQLFLNFKCVV